MALAWGVYLSSRVLRFPDITPDGSFPLGAAVAAALILGGVHPVLATLAAFVAGMAAGYLTGVLHTRFGVTELLTGILVMTGLYSVNLRVMGRSNLSMLDQPSVATTLHELLPMTAGWNADLTFGLIFGVMMVVLGLVLVWYLRTDFGLAMRAVGDNPAMITAQGVDRRRMVELGLALANGLVAFSGALIAQYQVFADVGMGVGTLVGGMAAVILGETLKPKRWGLGATILMAALGALAFRALIAVALRIGLNPVDLKLATAVFVLAALLSVGLVAVTFNTIRLQILTLRDEIEVSKLIGATNAFIRRPFFYLGILQGGLGGVTALAILAIVAASAGTILTAPPAESDL